MSKEQLHIPGFINQFDLFPGTRYMGSKNKIIDNLWFYLKDIEFDSFLDLFAGSNVVSYFMKTKGKEILTNDFLNMSYMCSKALIENTSIIVNDQELSDIINTPSQASYISNTFKGLYFTDSENMFLDQVRNNIDSLQDDFKKAIAISALVRACMKKRPRGIFTYTGNRYNDGRKDLRKSLENHFIENVKDFNNAVFDNHKRCQAFNVPSQQLNISADLVYLDPPYYNPKSDNDYVRRYHFVEGLALNWKGLEIQQHTKTKKFKSYSSPFSRKDTAIEAFHRLIEKHKDSVIVISYSSNSIPTKRELKNILEQYKERVMVYEIDHTYSFGNQGHKVGNKANRVKEYLFIGKN